MFPWQVFGLTGSDLLAMTSQARCGSVSLLAFVPAYRCGAVPESHRIPFSSSVGGGTSELFSHSIWRIHVGAIQEIVDNQTLFAASADNKINTPLLSGLVPNRRQ